MGKLYAIIAIISILVRQFYLPNPFECFGDSAIIINWIAEPIIHAVAYGMVGLVYHKGDAPVLGSILYLGTYAVIAGILVIMGIFSFAWWWIFVVVLIIAALLVGIVWMKERFFNA